MSIFGSGINRAIAALPAVIVISVIIGITAGVLAMIFYLPKKNRERYKHRRMLLFSYDFLNFKYMALGTIAKVLYIANAVVLIIVGLYFLFAINFLTGLAVIILGNVVLRILYELFLILYAIHDNLNQLTNHTTGREDEVITNDDIANAFAERKAKAHNYTPLYPVQPPHYPTQPPLQPPAPPSVQPPLQPPLQNPTQIPPQYPAQPPIEHIAQPPEEPPAQPVEESPAQPPEEPITQPLPLCTSCGNTLSEGAKFCNNCGTQV